MIGTLVFFSLAEQQMLSSPRPASPAMTIDIWVFLAVLAAVLLWLLTRSGPRRGRRVGTSERSAQRTKSFRPNRSKNWILVDGSNVMHWEDNTPQLDPIRRVVGALKAQGLDPGVVFDANVGWKLFGRYLGERELGQMLDLPPDQVLVVPKGSPADPWLLTTARDFGARIVTNDRYRDWAGDHPEVAEPGFLIHGGLTEGRVWLEGMDGGGSSGQAAR